MSKSTPISQLPIQQPQQPANEILTEDDTVIQDMLSNLSTSDPSQLKQEDIYKYVAAAAQMNTTAPSMVGAGMNVGNVGMGMGMVPGTSGTGVSKMVDLFSNELKIAGYVFMAVIIVHFVPFHKYLSKYLALEKIPYSEILLRAILAALLVVISQKLIT